MPALPIISRGKQLLRLVLVSNVTILISMLVYVCFLYEMKKSRLNTAGLCWESSGYDIQPFTKPVFTECVAGRAIGLTFTQAQVTQV